MGNTEAGHMRELLRVPQMNNGAPVLEIATETTPVAVTLFPASERSTHTLSATLKDCGVYRPIRPDSTGGLELLSARLSICSQKAARNTTQHTLNDEKNRMISQFAKRLPRRSSFHSMLFADRKPALPDNFASAAAAVNCHMERQVGSHGDSASDF